MRQRTGYDRGEREREREPYFPVLTACACACACVCMYVREALGKRGWYKVIQAGRKDRDIRSVHQKEGWIER